MATKKIDIKKTLKYAVAFHFQPSEKTDFMLGRKLYQYIGTVHDNDESKQIYTTLIVVYDYLAQKYDVLNMSESLGDREVKIIG